MNKTSHTYFLNDNKQKTHVHLYNQNVVLIKRPTDDQKYYN